MSISSSDDRRPLLEGNEHRTRRLSDKNELRGLAGLILLLLALCLSRPLSAADVQAKSPSCSHVQAAIDSAQDGDTVVVPAGSATWRNSVVLSHKYLTLQGAGMTQTVMIPPTRGNPTAFNLPLPFVN